VGKLIDVILPVLHREEAEQDLRWRDYLDILRLRALETGENIHKILTDGLKPLKRFFHVEKVWIFSEDDDLIHMLRLFARVDDRPPLYKIVDAPLAPEAILRSQLIPFPVREMHAGRVILYLSLPLIGTKPDDPGDVEQFLKGTEIYEGIQEDAMTYGMMDLKDIIFFLVTECLTANPKAVLTNLARRWPVRKGQGNLEVMLRVTRRILKRYTRFFDLFQTLSSNLEAALSYLRSRRDRLTGLHNRQSFQTILEGQYTRPGYPFGLMFIDMDNFKIFNDAVSHHFGDKILTALSDRLIRASDLITDESIPGRFGGDEFCFAVGGVEKEELEGIAVRVFTSITNEPLEVGFYIEDRPESSMLEINLISFLHRCMRPDVGSRQASLSEFVERPHRSPRGHVLDIYVHYRQLSGDSLGDLSEIILSEKIDSKTAGMIVDEISEIIIDKIVWNKILSEVDKTFRSIIRAFVALQLKNQTTDKIREKIISSIGKVVLEREITLKVSAGLAHSREHRLRSVSSLFKAADNRAYLAKQNGRNCLFGVDGQRLM
jgi:diguanylate cyclase (GGDEF)-like protein